MEPHGLPSGRRADREHRELDRAADESLHFVNVAAFRNPAVKESFET